MASNIALILAKPLKRNPKEIANSIKDAFVTDEEIIRVEVAGPGFINFFLSTKSHGGVLEEIFNQQEGFGKLAPNDQSVLIEYVSSNPTGPLHVGHGRGAVFGSVLGALLREAGFKVDEEYYVNDFGRQMNILAASLWLRYAQLFNASINMMKNGYQGDYLISIAENLKNIYSEEFYSNHEAILETLSDTNHDEETYTDNVIVSIQTALKTDFYILRDFALQEILALIKKDLLDFGVRHNYWFSESSLYESKTSSTSKVDMAIKDLNALGFIYEKEDAVWFKSSDLGDDKDRVLKRSNGEHTYFASDVAYHADKYDRGYDRIINIWGSDHHGYTPRVKAAMEASKRNTEQLEIVYIQFANLLRAGKKVTMSTRSGEFITLRELMDEVTTEAARFFYINRKSDQHLDFDLDLAKDQSDKNPVFYLQYAYARICNIIKRGKDSTINFEEDFNSTLLSDDEELLLLKSLIRFPEYVEISFENLEPQYIANYLQELASRFHKFYSHCRVLTDNIEKSKARMALVKAVKIALKNGLTVLGITSPERM